MSGTMHRYIFRNLLTALVLIAVVLSAIVFLTQSLKYLEIVIRASAAGGTFWFLTMLALPRFLEVILPVSLAISTIFIYYRMMGDQELAVLRSGGYSPLAMARSALILSGSLCCLLWIMTLWVTPHSIRKVETMQHELKAAFSTLFFQEGVFNRFGDDITVFIRERAADGELRGLMIHDKRARNKNPVTITARSGKISVDEQGQTQITVFDGSRQDYNPNSDVLNRLDFSRYRIDLPGASAAGDFWYEANERTTMELLSPDLSDARDVENLAMFRIELHRRLASPLLCLTFSLISLAFMLLGEQGRRGLGRRVTGATMSILLLQSCYIVALNLTRQHEILGLSLMYMIIFLPIGGAYLLLSPWGEALRRTIFYSGSMRRATECREASS